MGINKVTRIILSLDIVFIILLSAPTNYTTDHNYGKLRLGLYATNSFIIMLTKKSDHQLSRNILMYCSTHP